MSVCKTNLCFDVSYNNENDLTTVTLSSAKGGLQSNEYMALVLPDAYKRGTDGVMALLVKEVGTVSNNDCYGTSKPAACASPSIRSYQGAAEMVSKRTFAGRCQDGDNTCTFNQKALTPPADQPFNTLKDGQDEVVSAIDNGDGTFTVTFKGSVSDVTGVFGTFEKDSSNRNLYGFTSAVEETPGEPATNSPTQSPTRPQTESPTQSPTKAGATNSPTQAPTLQPTTATTVTNSPTSAPTSAPTSSPTKAGTVVTNSPTLSPTVPPTPAVFTPSFTDTIFDNNGKIEYQILDNGVVNAKIQMSVSSNQGWIGFGISDSGNMVGSYAYIGQYFSDGTSVLKKYRLTGKTPSDVIPINSRLLASSDCPLEATMEKVGDFLTMTICDSEIGGQNFLSDGEMRGLIYSYSTNANLVAHKSDAVGSLAAQAGRPTATPAPTPSGGDDDSNTGAIVGGVIGGIVGVALLIFLFIFISRRRASRSNASADDKAKQQDQNAAAQDSAESVKADIEKGQQGDAEQVMRA